MKSYGQIAYEEWKIDSNRIDDGDWDNVPDKWKKAWEKSANAVIQEYQNRKADQLEPKVGAQK